MDLNSILIIDDEADICFLLENKLKKKNYKISYAHNLEDGFSKLASVQPFLLFLDINLPDGSGLNAISKIKLLHPSIKIIIISAYDGVNERILAKTEGADMFVGKPFNEEAIYTAVDQIKVR